VLKKVKYKNGIDSLEDAVINTDEIVSARATDSRGIGPWTSVLFKDGSHMTIRGTPDELMED